MHRRHVTRVSLAAATIAIGVALPLSVVDQEKIKGSSLTILWAVFGTALAIAVLSLDVVWSRVRSVAGRFPYEIRRKRDSPAARLGPSTVTGEAGTSDLRGPIRLILGELCGNRDRITSDHFNVHLVAPQSDAWKRYQERLAAQVPTDLFESLHAAYARQEAFRHALMLNSVTPGEGDRVVAVIDGTIKRLRREIGDEGGSLDTEIARGDALLREARQPSTVANNSQLQSFMRRGEEWASRVSTALGERGDYNRQDYWDRLPLWEFGVPRRDKPESIRRGLVGPLLDRMELLERFARDIGGGVADDDPRGIAHPNHFQTPDEH